MPNTHQAMYTPGPWKVEQGRDMHRAYTVITAEHEGMHAASPLAMVSNILGVEAALPDANLIAAAPKLLEACEVAFAELENHKGVPGVLEHVLPCIRAAIARATGGAV